MLMNTPAILLIAAGPLQLPAFEEARRRGLRIVAVDRDPGAPGMRLAHAAHAVDIKHVAEVVQMARREAVSGVMSVCTDFAVRAVAAVGQAMSLPAIGPEAAERATDKRNMRHALGAAGVPCPRFAEVGSLDHALAEAGSIGYPVALKIPCSAGSRGVYEVSDAGELRRTFSQARELEPKRSLLVEEWLEGPEVSVEGVVAGRDACVVQITDKMLFPGRYPVEAGHTQPSRLPRAVVDAVETVTLRAIAALDFAHCGFHAELKITPRGPCVIEIAARLGGDHISTDLTRLSTGTDLVSAVMDIALGRRPDLTAPRRQGSAIRYFQLPVSGELVSVRGLEEISGRAGFQYLCAQTERGETLRPGLRVEVPVRSSLDRHGHVIFAGADAAEAAARADAAVSSLQFQIR
jgi:biotin carboxylase